MKNKNPIAVKDIDVKAIFDEIREKGSYEGTFGPIPEERTTEVISILSNARDAGVNANLSTTKIGGEFYVKASFRKSKAYDSFNGGKGLK